MNRPVVSWRPQVVSTGRSPSTKVMVLFATVVVFLLFFFTDVYADHIIASNGCSACMCYVLATCFHIPASFCPSHLFSVVAVVVVDTVIVL